MSYTVAPTTASFVGLGFSIGAQTAAELEQASPAESPLAYAPVPPVTTSFIGLGFAIGMQSSVQHDAVPPAPFGGFEYALDVQSTAQPEQASTPLACLLSPSVQAGEKRGPPPYPFPRRRNPEKLNAPTRCAGPPPFPFPRRRKDLLQTPDVVYTRWDPRRMLGIGSPPPRRWSTDTLAPATHAL